jgi:hypothetical protein
VTAVRRDLTRRLRPLQAALKRRLARADVFADMIRAVNASLEPERVAEALVSRLSAWIPVPTTVGDRRGRWPPTGSSRDLNRRHMRWVPG